MRFFADFSDFGSILGGQDPSKKWPKIKKMVKNAILERDARSMVVLGGFGEGFERVLGGFWRVLGRFWKDFVRILEGLWEDFGKHD